MYSKTNDRVQPLTEVFSTPVSTVAGQIGGALPGRHLAYGASRSGYFCFAGSVAEPARFG